MSYQKNLTPIKTIIHQIRQLKHCILNNSLVQRRFFNRAFIVFFVGCFCIAAPFNSFSQNISLLSPSAIKKLSVEELMNIEITSVSKTPEKLTEVASAIQVITSEDIRRSSTTRLPGALRLATNLQVARANSHDWAITARGFNAAPLSINTLSDKLLVMIDGRTVYEPLFGGVSWDVQNVLLEDIDRIEVVSGPGGTLWGANAINGVINVNSKSAKETQGLYASGSYGEFFKDFGALRYGSHIDSTFFFRVYGQRFDHNSSKLINGNSANDKWNMTQGGFRMDFLPSSKTTLTLQGDSYKGKQNQPLATFLDGANVIGRLSHTFSENSDMILQVYYDRTWRNSTASTFKNEINTYDIDFQHHLNIGSRNRIVWGAGYRIMDNKVNRAFNPTHKTLELFSGFVQNQIALIPQLLELTLGTKLLHNDYTSFEWQPSTRLAWTPDNKHTVWAAVSRAVRTPARFDSDLTNVTTAEQFKSEKVIAYELGYRIRPIERISFSLASFYNTYTDLRSFNAKSPPPGTVIANNQEAKTWGLEISGNAVVSNWWRLRGGYTFLKKKFTSTSTNVLPISNLVEALDPKNQVMLQSILDLPKHFQLDCISRYVDKIEIPAPTPSVSSYFILDARFAWEYKAFSIAIVGENLIKKTNREFVSREIPRSVFTNLAIRF